MRLALSALLLLGSAHIASAEQFIATFLSPSHPNTLNIQITQFDASGGTIDTERQRIARIGAGQSTWAVNMLPSAARVCVSLRGSQRITSARALMENGSEQALAATSDGRTTCTPGSLSNLDMIVVNFD